MSRYWVNRTMCDALAEMRKCVETGNYSYLPGLLEEVQSMANRMESGLGDKRDLIKMKEEWHSKKKKLKKLDAKIAKLKKEVKK